MRSLVTGGAGFIGSHLAEELLGRGDAVAVIDDLSTGSIKNIEHLKGEVGFSYHIGTIQDRALLAELVDAADVVYHLAAAVGVRLIIESPVLTLETNIRGTEIVLELAAKKRKKVVIASTSEIYGKANTIHQVWLCRACTVSDRLERRAERQRQHRRATQRAPRPDLHVAHRP